MSLNDELGTVVERVREAEEGVASHRKEVESLREQVSASERVIRHLRSHDEDTQATLQARDSQIQVSNISLWQSLTNYIIAGWRKLYQFVSCLCVCLFVGTEKRIERDGEQRRGSERETGWRGKSEREVPISLTHSDTKYK